MTNFVGKHPEGNFFQSPAIFDLYDNLSGFCPLLIICLDNQEKIKGSLLGVIKSEGKGLKSYFSRRVIIWGGPLFEENANRTEVLRGLLEKLKMVCEKRAIYIEFRNLFDTSELRSSFENFGYNYKPHLNYIVKIESREALFRRMSKSRKRQIRSSIEAGAITSEPKSEGELQAFYRLLVSLYKEKVKKPLPRFEFFTTFWKSRLGKIFLIKHGSEILGGIVCPIFQDRTIYEWYICGTTDCPKAIYPSVLATWAPMEFALRHQIKYFDFLGAGAPDTSYGVREFKKRFGGSEVENGRYHLTINKPLYGFGKFGLKLLKKVSKVAS